MRTKSATVQEKILASAELMFASKRFHEVRMEDLAMDAGVGKGTIYRYFKDKEELYTALLKVASGDLIKLLENTMKLQTSPKNKLIAILESSIQLFDAKPHLFDLILYAEVFQNSNNDFVWQQTRRNVIQIVENIFQMAENEKEFHIRNHKEAALLLLGGIRAIIRFGNTPRPVNLCTDLVNHFLYGFSKPQTCPTSPPQT